MTKKNTKSKKMSIVKKLSIRLRIIPDYWKIVFSVILAIGGWTLGSKMFFSSDDFSLIAGVVVISVVLWLLINMWLPRVGGKE